MKKALILAITIACALAFTAPAFAAANPFADVPASHWAYEAVSDLYKAGIIVGNEGRFDGQKAITRYEVAQMVYAATKNAAKANPDQKKQLDKLQAEFAAELKALGARVAKLEAAGAAKSPVIIMGYQRITAAYRKDAYRDATSGLDPARRNYFTYRTRLEWFVPVDKTFTFYGRLRAQNYDVTNPSDSVNTPSVSLTTSKPAPNSGTFNAVRAEVFQVWVNNPFGIKSSKMTFGRGGMYLGKAGFALAVGDHDFITFEKQINKSVKYTTQYGNAMYGSAFGNASRWWNNQVNVAVNKGFNIDIYNQHRLFPNGDNMRGFGNLAQVGFSTWSLGFDKTVTKKIKVFGEYAKNTRELTGSHTATNGQPLKPSAYWVGITNGNPALHPAMGTLAPSTKPGADAWAVLYKKLEKGAVFMPDNQLNAILGNADTAASGCLWLTDNVKGPEFYYQRTLAKGVVLQTQFGYKMKYVEPKLAGTSQVGSYGVVQFHLFF